MAGPYRPTGRLGCPADGRTPKACHTRATAEHHQGALAVTHAQTRWSLTCKDAGFNRPDSVLLSSRPQVRILLGAQPGKTLNRARALRSRRLPAHLCEGLALGPVAEQHRAYGASRFRQL